MGWAMPQSWLLDEQRKWKGNGNRVRTLARMGKLNVTEKLRGDGGKIEARIGDRPNDYGVCRALYTVRLGKLYRVSPTASRSSSLIGLMDPDFTAGMSSKEQGERLVLAVGAYLLYATSLHKACLHSSYSMYGIQFNPIQGSLHNTPTKLDFINSHSNLLCSLTT